MLSAASASPVSSYASIPVPAPRKNDASAPAAHVAIQVANRFPLPASQRPLPPAIAAWRASGEDVAAFGKHLRNVDKATTSAGVSLAATARSRTDIVTALDDARITLDNALRDFAPGFPDQFDVPLASDRTQRAIPPLLAAIEDYEKQVRRVESMQARSCKPLTACIAALALSIAVAGSAIALCMPPVRPTPEEEDILHPGVRLSAAMLAYVPLVSVGLHYVMNGKTSTIDLRAALSALRTELRNYAVANALHASPAGVPSDVMQDGPGQVGPHALDTATANVTKPRSKSAPVHDETITIDMPCNGSHFLA